MMRVDDPWCAPADVSPKTAGALVFVGAAPDTGNLGVSALSHAAIVEVFRRCPDARIVVFDHGRGVRLASDVIADRRFTYVLCGASNSRRLHRPESLWRCYIAQRLGIYGGETLRAIRAAGCMLGVSGGDSFSDMYEMRRFWTVALPMLIALECRTPLILIPQTYGPFRSAKARRVAQQIVRGAAMAWARDSRSFDILRDLLGSDHFDPARHRFGVDVAFALPANEPRHDRLPPPMREWLTCMDNQDGPLVGLNISGLIWHDPTAARSRYGLRADYREAIVHLLDRLLHDPARPRVLLVPHVLSPEGHYESDPHACRLAMQTVLERRPDAADRITTVPPDFDACEMKWIISRCNWFCGTRMHSTIAALSSGVPAAAIAYSDKTLGVFETCGQGEHVHDPRLLTTDELVEHTFASFHQRDAARSALAAALPSVLAKADEQMDVIAAFIKSLGRTRDAKSAELTGQQA